MPRVGSCERCDGHGSAHVKCQGRGGAMESGSATTEAEVDVEGDGDNCAGGRAGCGGKELEVGAERGAVESLGN